MAPLVGHSGDPQTTVLALSAMIGRQLPLFSVLIPGYLIVVLCGWRRMAQILPAAAVAGVSFAVVQFSVSNFVGPELTDDLAALRYRPGPVAARNRGTDPGSSRLPEQAAMLDGAAGRERLAYDDTAAPYPAAAQAGRTEPARA